MKKKQIHTLATSQQATFELLVRPHAKALYHAAYQFTRSAEDAEDLVQDLFIKLYPRLDELLKIERVKPWMMRVMYHLFIDSKRRQLRSPLHLVDHHRSDDDQESSNTTEQIADTEDTPEQSLSRKYQQQQLQAAIEQLSEDHQHIIILHDIEGYNHQELQTILDSPAGTIKSRLHRARAQLRAILEKIPSPDQPR